MIHIMMAVYNGGKFIREQINSILSQTYKEWKLWINDDGSSDDTVEILTEYQQKYPQKIELLNSSHKRKGAKGNFAYLYESVSEAEYYTFCDQDDIWKKDKLSKMLSNIAQEDSKKPILTYHDLVVVDQDKNVIASSFIRYSNLRIDEGRKLQQLLVYNYVPGCAMMFNHAFKEQIDKIPENCIMHDWWILLSAYCLGVEVIKVDAPLALYRQHGNNVVGAVKVKSIRETTKKCFDLVHINRYINNNLRLKKERICQGELLLGKYNEKLPEANLIIIKEYLKLLKSNKGWKNFIEARKKGYVFYNMLYTLKFYLLS